MKECPICHEPNGDYRDTCFNCHTSLNFKKYDATNSDMKECPKCGAVNNHSSYSCYNCGANLAEVKNIYNGFKVCLIANLFMFCGERDY